LALDSPGAQQGGVGMWFVLLLPRVCKTRQTAVSASLTAFDFIGGLPNARQSSRDAGRRGRRQNFSKSTRANIFYEPGQICLTETVLALNQIPVQPLIRFNAKAWSRKETCSSRFSVR
jgi:hypothetical protein